MTNIKRAFLAILTVAISLGFGVGLASAHSNAVTATKQCQSNGTYTVTWKVTNDYGLAETASLVSSTGGGTFAGFPISIASGNGQFGTATQSGITASSASVVVKGTWTDHFNTTNDGSINLGGNCPINHQPVTLCHNGHTITIDDDAVVKQGHDGHPDDIIPSFTYFGDDHQSHTYPGKNLNKIGLLQTGCQEKPTKEPKVITTDDGAPKCGDTNVATTTTTTTYTYTYTDGQWVEHSTVVVTHGTRPVETAPCPTIPTTTLPPTTTVPPTTVPPTTVPPTTVVVTTTVPPVVTTVPATTVPVVVVTTVPPTLPPATVPPTTIDQPQLPTTGSTTTGIAVLAGVLILIGGTMVIVRRKFRNVA